MEICSHWDKKEGYCQNMAREGYSTCEKHKDSGALGRSRYETRVRKGISRTSSLMLVLERPEVESADWRASLIHEFVVAIGSAVPPAELKLLKKVAKEVDLPAWLGAVIREISTSSGRASAMPAVETAPVTAVAQAAEAVPFTGIALLGSSTRKGPMRGAPVKKAAARKAATKKAPAKKAPAKKATTKRAAAKKAAAKKASAKKAPKKVSAKKRAERKSAR